MKLHNSKTKQNDNESNLQYILLVIYISYIISYISVLGKNLKEIKQRN